MKTITIDCQLIKALKTKDNNQLMKLTQQLPYLKKENTRYNHQLSEDAWSETLAKFKLDKFLQYLIDHNLELIPDNATKIRQYYVNLLNRMFFCNLIDQLRKEHYQVSLDAFTDTDKQQTYLDLQQDEKSTLTIDLIIEKEQRKNLKTTLQWIIQDPENRFKSIHLKKNSKCNVSELLKRRLQGEKWENIAQSLDLKYGTVTGFWFKKAKPVLKQVLEEFMLD